MLRRSIAAAFLAFLAAGTSSAGMTLVHLSPRDLREARVEGLRAIPFERGLFEGAGRLESPPLEALRPFDDLVGSLNAEVPPGASAELSAQARVDGRWTAWYRLLRLTPDGGESLGRQEDADGWVEVDTLKLRRKADAFRYRVALESGSKAKASLSRVAFAYVDSAAAPPKPAAFRPGPWVRELKLKARSQMEEQAAFRRDICSPTSLAMVMDYWGKRLPTAAVARAVQDRGSSLYGNWPLNVAFAARRGLPGHVARLEGLEALQDEIAAGRPVVASVTFGPGELEGAPLTKTAGHLLVVAGFTPDGDVIALDPAAGRRSQARRVYRRGQFARAWLENKRGLAYVLGPRFPSEAVAAVPAADLRAKPGAPASPKALDRDRLTQVLYGEPVILLKAKDDWVYARVPRQPRRRRGRWQGYEGWLPASAVKAPPRPYAPRAIVILKRVEASFQDLQGRTRSLWLPLGASLEARAAKDGGYVGRLLRGRDMRLPAGALRLDGLPAKDLRGRIVRAASQFIGDAYVWGGLSGVPAVEGWGVDCSGLVHAAYRSAGLEIPRDAEDQFRKARRLEAAEIQAGDLVFLTRSARSRTVDHVLLYAGGERLIESRLEAGRAVETTFRKRFGAGLSELKNGGVVREADAARPRKRRIHFGSLLEAP